MRNRLTVPRTCCEPGGPPCDDGFTASFSDDFNRGNSGVVGNQWQEYEGNGNENRIFASSLLQEQFSAPTFPIAFCRHPISRTNAAAIPNTIECEAEIASLLNDDGSPFLGSPTAPNYIQLEYRLQLTESGTDLGEDSLFWFFTELHAIIRLGAGTSSFYVPGTLGGSPITVPGTPAIGDTFGMRLTLLDTSTTTTHWELEYLHNGSAAFTLESTPYGSGLKFPNTEETRFCNAGVHLESLQSKSAGASYGTLAGMRWENVSGSMSIV